jgi:hypothetical protein
MNQRKDVWLWALMVLLTISLVQVLLSGQRGPVSLAAMVCALVGLVVVGWALLKEGKRSKS